MLSGITQSWNQKVLNKLLLVAEKRSKWHQAGIVPCENAERCGDVEIIYFRKQVSYEPTAREKEAVGTFLLAIT